MDYTKAYDPIITQLKAHEIPESYPAETIATFEDMTCYCLHDRPMLFQ